MNIEIAFVISVWVVAFLICLAIGIPLFVTIFVSSAMAYGLRKLWLRRLILYNEQLLSGLITILCVTFVITDRYGIASYTIWFINEHGYFNIYAFPFLYWKLSLVAFLEFYGLSESGESEVEIQRFGFFYANIVCV